MTIAHKNKKKKKTPSLLMMRAANAAVAVAFFLILMKSWAYNASSSVSMLGSLLDSIMDMFASLINLVAVRLSLAPADDDHRFGHGKAEAIAGLVQAMVIFLSALFLLQASIEKFLNPEPIMKANLGIAVIILTIILTSLLVFYQRYVIRKTESVTISADSLHYAGDLYLNLGVLLALFLSGYMGFYYADPIIGALVALYLMYNVKLIGLSSVDMLMDKEMDDADREKIIEVINSHPEVCGIHDMKTRKSGLKIFIQFHMEMKGDISLSEAHHISDEVEAEVMVLYPEAEVLIHADPEDHKEIIAFKEE